MSAENPHRRNIFESLNNVNKEKLSDWFKNANFEIIPPEKTIIKLDQVPMDKKISVISSPTKSVEHTIQFSQGLIESGRKAVMPHIAARHFKDSDHVTKVINKLQELGVNQIFSIAGDNPNPSGPFKGSLDFLKEIQKQNIHIDKVNIAGYPEGHPKISKADLNKNLLEKQAWARETGTEMSIVTQICFDSKKVVDWIEKIRRLGVTLPVVIGIPVKGINLHDLYKLAERSGVGDSMNIINQNPGLISKLVKASIFGKNYAADDFLASLSRMTSEGHKVEGMHIFTYFKIPLTMEWVEKSKDSLK